MSWIRSRKHFKLSARWRMENHTVSRFQCITSKRNWIIQVPLIENGLLGYARAKIQLAQLQNAIEKLHFSNIISSLSMGKLEIRNIERKILINGAKLRVHIVSSVSQRGSLPVAVFRWRFCYAINYNNELIRIICLYIFL